jgi:hypothetical protein
MRLHFYDLHPLDYVTVPNEGRNPGCPRCGMQVDPRYPAHINTKERRAGMEQCHQQDMVVHSALALRQQFTVHGVCWRRSRHIGILDTCSCRMTMTSKPCKTSFARRAGRVSGSDRCCTGKMHHLGLHQKPDFCQS